MILSIPATDPISPQGRAISDLFLTSLAISAVVFLVVAGLLIAFLYRSHRRRDGEPSQVSGNRRIEIIWTLLPLLILVAIFGFTVRAMRQVDHASSAGDTLEVAVIGHQWWWEFRYPGTTAVTANELHVPTGTPIKVTITGSDVIHSFWVTRFGWKIDAIPNRDNVMWLEVDRAGVYEGACAEFCGTQHAWMRIRVVAQEPADFQSWLEAEGRTADTPATDPARDGEGVFMRETCIICHTIRGTDANGTVGPDLTHVGSRMTLGAGVIENTDEELEAWIKDAHDIKPGVLMPPFPIAQDEIDALVAYLRGLK